MGYVDTNFKNNNFLFHLSFCVFGISLVINNILREHYNLATLFAASAGTIVVFVSGYKLISGSYKNDNPVPRWTAYLILFGATLMLLAATIQLTGAVNIDNFVSDYEKFEMEGSLEEEQERVYAECTCIGLLNVLESYPPQYNCGGLELCSDENYTREGLN